MSCSVTSVFTFKIESTFDEWAAIFDSKEADKRHSEFDIKPLFRGVSKEDPQKIIVIHQAPEGNVQKFVEANGDWMSTHRSLLTVGLKKEQLAPFLLGFSSKEI